MNPSNLKKPASDNSFSAFAVGVSVGVAAAFLFGTEEGRKLVKKVVDTIPEKYKKIPGSPSPVGAGLAPARTYDNHPPHLDIPLQETPHHSIFDTEPSWQSHSTNEAPPPPPPHVHPSRPEPFIP